MIHNEQNDRESVKTIWYYQNMQYEVDPIDQSRENGPQLTGSFKTAIRLIRVARQKI